MARKRPSAPPPPPAAPPPAEPPADPRRQVYLDADLYRMAGIVARFLEVSRPDYINARLRPIIQAEYDEILRTGNVPH